MNGVNLIPATRRTAANRRARVRTWCAVLAGSAVACSAGTAAFRAVWLSEGRPVRDEIAAAQATRAEHDARLIKLRGEIAGLRRADLAARMIGEHPDWSLLLRAVNQARGDSVALETFELRADAPTPTATPQPAQPGAAATPAPPRPTERYTLRMRGIATDLARVMEFVGRLEKLGALDSVTMKQSRAELSHGVTVTGFDIECALAEGPAVPPTATPASASAEAPAGETRP